MKKKTLLALVACMGFAASALTVESASNDVQRVAGTSTAGVTSFNDAEPPGGYGGGGDKPEGDPPEGDPPEGTGGDTGGGEQGGGETGGGGGTPPGGGSEDSVILTGAYSYTSETNTLIGATLESTTSDQYVILAMTNAYVTVSNCVLNKSGDMSSEDNSNFYAVNAVVAAKTASTVCIDHSTLNSNAKGANCLFASGSGSTIHAYDCTLNSTSSSSRGLDATYGGTVIASKMDITTESDHCAALATDRGNGYISATDSSLSTAGQGSPLIYSTGAIEVNGVTGTATGAQIAGIEGLSAIRIKNAKLTGSAEKASESVPNGVIIYQSNSGDYTEGTATFEVSDSTLNSSISDGAMFYVTHTESIITIQNTELEFDTNKNYLLKAAGNDGENGWGTAGSNGAGVTLTAIDQTLNGNISVDGISSNDLYLVNSTYKGTFVKDTTYTGNGGANVFIDATSKWIVTSNCTLKCLTAASDAKIVDASGNTVSIVGTDETEYVSGTSDPKITVSSYIVGDFVATNITDFTIDRTAFNAMYGLSQSQEGEDEGTGTGGGSGTGGTSGGVEDHNNWTNYFKPHPPENAIVKVRVEGASDYGTPDRDHKYCLDGYWDGNPDGVVVHLLYAAEKGYLFSDGCKSNTWDVTVTNNAQEVYPPEDVVAIRTQAKSGSTYYLTLKEAIEKAGGKGKDGTQISLNDSFTLEETLTVTNSITLDLNTNTVTIASALTPAFLFAATATVSNGAIRSSLVANADDSVLLRFSDCKATLSDVTLSGDCCLLYVDDRAAVTITNGCVLACNGAATVYCSSNGTIAVAGDTRKDDGVVMSAPEGYLWESNKLVSGTLSDSFTAGVTTNSYEDPQSATNAAEVINANKASAIVVPTEVEGSARATYLTKVEATVTSDNCVVIDLTPAAKEEEQTTVDEAVTNETVVASLVSTNSATKATLAKTTAGLYYWIEGGTDLGANLKPGPAELSKGGSVELSKPTLETTEGRAFFRISAGVSAP